GDREPPCSESSPLSSFSREVSPSFHGQKMSSSSASSSPSLDSSIRSLSLPSHPFAQVSGRVWIIFTDRIRLPIELYSFIFHRTMGILDSPPLDHRLLGIRESKSTRRSRFYLFLFRVNLR